jgi:competence protein ComEA
VSDDSAPRDRASAPIVLPPDLAPGADADRSGLRSLADVPDTDTTWRRRVGDAIAWVRLQPARAGALAVGAVVVAVALWWLLRPPPAPAPESVLPVVTTGAGGAAVPLGSSAATTAAVPSTVVVHVSGAVARPGVLHLPAGTRVVDAVDAAGGATVDADTDRVNLASVLADGMRVHIPRVGEATPPEAVGSGPDATTPAAPLDLNRATAEQLEQLPGIGPATAAAIVEHRERHGPFASVDALTDVSGIGEAKLAQIRDLVRV